MASGLTCFEPTFILPGNLNAICGAVPVTMLVIGSVTSECFQKQEELFGKHGDDLTGLVESRLPNSITRERPRQLNSPERVVIP